MTGDELEQVRAVIHGELHGLGPGSWGETMRDYRQRNGNAWAGEDAALNRAAREEAAKHQQSRSLAPDATIAREASDARLERALGQQSVAPLFPQRPAVIREEYAVRPQLGTAFQAPAGHSPSRPFTRADILAILRAQKCLNDTHKVPGMREGGDDVLRGLITIFENLE